ncbi:unnamed protein product [Calypogeia fissa]
MAELFRGKVEATLYPIVEGGQWNLKFWDRVGGHYNQNRPRGTQERGQRSLDSKWHEVRHDVAKFSGSYARVEDLRMSGRNAEDVLKKAQELYVEQHQKKKDLLS